jgi:hypothetical protein
MNKQTVLKVLQEFCPEAAKNLRKIKCNTVANVQTTYHDWLDHAFFFTDTPQGNKYWWLIYGLLRMKNHKTKSKVASKIPKEIKILLDACENIAEEYENDDLTETARTFREKINKVKAMYNV